MDFDDYIRQMTQKYCLAVAIAVIKNKPSNLSIEEYIEDLKNKINDNTESFSDITIHSDDFNIDDDHITNVDKNLIKVREITQTNDIQCSSNSETILKDLNIGENRMNIGINGTFVSSDDVMQFNDCDQIANNSSQNTFYEASQSRIPSQNIQNDTDIFYDRNNDDLFNCNQNLLSQNICGNNQNNMETETILHKELGTEFPIDLDVTFCDSDVTKNAKSKNADIIDKDKEINTNKQYDSQATIIYSLHGFTQNYTHISQSQDDLNIPKKYINGTGVTNEANNTFANNINQPATTGKHAPKRTENQINLPEDSTTQMVLEMNDTFDPNIDIFSQNNSNTLDTVFTFNNDDESNSKSNDSLFINISKDTSSRNVMEVDTFLPNTDIFIEDAQNINNIEDTINKVTKNASDIVKQSSNDLACKNKIIIENKDINTGNDISIAFSNTDSEIDNNSDNEVVPFKVIEELNKVKSYLNKKDRRMSNDEYSTDSGYRSDSQKKNSQKLTQSSNCLNQAAQYLLEYTLHCSLVVATRDITNEISQSLGQLIDRLHEEEVYPQFLEEVLHSIDILLRDIHVGVSSEEKNLSQKDESIQRVYVLNKSTHIQKYTIEKITHILQSLETKLTEDEYEITYIHEIENSYYIFHLLELLLKKYITNKETSKSQCSQDERVLKKSSITEIWKKKWNPNEAQKETRKEPQSVDNRIVLTKCSEILNKLIVGCIDEYSLVSFAALQCFNIIQK